MSDPIKRRLDKIEAVLDQLEPSVPRRALTAQEQIELDELARTAPGGDPFSHPFAKMSRWKDLHFVQKYGHSVAELYAISKQRPACKGALTAAIAAVRRKELN